MKKQIGIISAYNKSNNGMLTVDLAAERFAHHQKDSVDIINIQRKRWSPFPRFKYIRDPKQLNSYSHVIYWGDFLNNPVYGLHEFCGRDNRYKLTKTKESAQNYWMESCLNATGGISDSVKIASVGQCFIGCMKYRNDEAVRGAFSHFCERADLIMPRENASLKELKELSGISEESHLYAGLDMAFLNEFGQVSREQKKGAFSFCFFRSNIQAEDYKIENLAKIISMKKEFLPWKRYGTWPKNQLENSLSVIKRSDFVLTDVYHICVNSLNMGVPVICIMTRGKDENTSKNDMKKKALFEAIGARKLIIEVEPKASIDDAFSEIETVINDVLKDPQYMITVEKNIKLKKDLMMRQLNNFVGGC